MTQTGRSIAPSEIYIRLVQDPRREAPGYSSPTPSTPTMLICTAEDGHKYPVDTSLYEVARRVAVHLVSRRHANIMQQLT